MRSLAIAGNSLRRFFRDRTALFFTVALPIVLIIVVGNATSQFDDEAASVGIVDHSNGPLARQLVAALGEHDRIALERYEDRLTLAKDVRRGRVPAGITIPAGYDAALLAGDPVDVELVLDQTRGSPAAIRSLISEVIADEGGVLQAAAFASERADVSMPAALERAERSRGQVSGVAVGVRTETIGEADEDTELAPGIGYQAPSNLILFVFITSLAGSALLIQSRQLRVLQRMYATPTDARTILFGEGLARFGIAAFQAILIFLVGRFVFDVDWGDPVGAAALVVVFVLLGTAFGMLFGTVFSTPEQAGSIGAMSGIAMGMLGGCMWPLEIVPAPMRMFGHIFPHAWAMDAWTELIGGGGSLGDIGTELAVLVGFAVVIFPVAIWRLRRALVS